MRIPVLAFIVLSLLGIHVGSCQVTDFSDDPRNPAMAVIPDRPGLSRVLLIGDSISIGYTLPTRSRLEAIANVHRIVENGGSTTNALVRLESWLGAGHWDVIHFNWGLHDLKLNVDGTRWVPLELYEANLRKLVARLRKTGARLIFATTTPVPEGVQGVKRDPADAPRYNAVAVQVMKENGVLINDLFQVARAGGVSMQLKQNVHFTPSGSAILGQAVAEAIGGALGRGR